MLLARRASPRHAHHFPVGTEVIARPATVSRPIDGVVVELSAAVRPLQVRVVDCSGSAIQLANPSGGLGQLGATTVMPMSVAALAIRSS